MKKTNLLITFLVVLLLLATGYIAYDKYSQIQQNKQFLVYQDGAQAGYEEAIIQIAQQAATCQQVPLRILNDTLEIVAIDCLQS